MVSKVLKCRLRPGSDYPRCPVVLPFGGDKRTQGADIKQAIKLAEDWQQQGKAKPTVQLKASKKR